MIARAALLATRLALVGVLCVVVLFVSVGKMRERAS